MVDRMLSIVGSLEALAGRLHRFGWEPFTTLRKTTGARGTGPDQGKRAYGEEARRLLAGKTAATAEPARQGNDNPLFDLPGEPGYQDDRPKKDDGRIVPPDWGPEVEPPAKAPKKTPKKTPAKPAAKAKPSVKAPVKPTAKAPEFHDHPFKGKSEDEQIKALIRPEDSSKWNANPRGYDLTRYPSGVDGKRLEEDVKGELASASQNNSFKSPTIKELYESLKGRHQGMSVHDFQGSLAKMNADKQIRLSAYTGNAASIPDKMYVVPLDMENKYYVHTGAAPPKQPAPPSAPKVGQNAAEQINNAADHADKIFPGYKGRVSRAGSLQEKLAALSVIDTEIFDTINNDPKTMAKLQENGLSASNEYLRQVSDGYAIYQKEKDNRYSGKQAKEDFLTQMDRLPESMRRAVKALRFLGKNKEADFYEQSAIPVAQLMAKEVEGGGTASAPKPATTTPLADKISEIKKLADRVRNVDSRDTSNYSAKDVESAMKDLRAMPATDLLQVANSLYADDKFRDTRARLERQSKLKTGSKEILDSIRTFLTATYKAALEARV